MITPGTQTTLTIRTPEGVSFSLPLATPAVRCLAWTVDLLVTWFMLIAMMIVVGMFTAIAPGAFAIFLYLSILAIPILYGMLFEWLWKGQTIGKKITGLRVVDETGLNLTPSQIIVRNLLRAVDSLPVVYLVGGTACALSPRCQRFGDLAAGTVVVRTQKEVLPKIDGILGGKYNSFRDHPHIEARLRNGVTPAEAHAALSSVLRRDHLDPKARLALYSELADHLRERAVFPESATYGMTDEQYVRNVVDTLFRKRGEAVS